ncbi:MAG: GntR family transcriptional regulator [Candidatus Aegiribacteria sp.]
MFRIDPKSAIPVYRQLKKQIQRHIVSGGLAEGDRLPSIRQMASELRINPNTVARSYRELENEGLVVSRKGSGVFVSTGDMDLQKNRMELFNELADEFLARAAGLGLDGDEILELLSGRLRGENDHG